MINNGLKLEQPNTFHRIEPNIAEAEQILANRFYHKLSTTNVYGYYLTYTLLIAYFTFSSLSKISPVYFFVSILTGLLLWSFTEYSMHRFSFHFKSTHPSLKTSTFLLHGIHHAYPREVSHSITPLLISLPLAAFFYLLFHFIFGQYTSGIFDGFLMGYVFYTIIHDATHHFAMNNPILKKIKIHHMKHHYFNTEKNFGVSSPLWDYIFKTYC